jgi:hypothetical protein
MKRTAILSIIICLFTVTLAHGNATRTATFMIRDLIDDPLNIAAFPNQIPLFSNCLWGDISRTDPEDYGIIIKPGDAIGAFTIWQSQDAPVNGFNLGYGRQLFNFDFGISGMYLEDYRHFGVGIGRTFFSKRFDLSFLMNDNAADQWFKINEHALIRRGDFILEERYSYSQIDGPLEYSEHVITPFIQRLILNEGFVYLAADFVIETGDVDQHFTNAYAGFELPLNRTFILRLGVMETFDEDFIPMNYQIQPGIGMKIREFGIDFLFNKARLSDHDSPLLNSVGLDLNFGRF